MTDRIRADDLRLALRILEMPPTWEPGVRPVMWLYSREAHHAAEFRSMGYAVKFIPDRIPTR